MMGCGNGAYTSLPSNQPVKLSSVEVPESAICPQVRVAAVDWPSISCPHSRYRKAIRPNMLDGFRRLTSQRRCIRSQVGAASVRWVGPRTALPRSKTAERLLVLHTLFCIAFVLW